MGDEEKVNDKKEVSANTFMHRMNICGGCEHLNKGLRVSRCNLCGCILALKARMEKESCPVKKW
jgi:hypothetical protein